MFTYKLRVTICCTKYDLILTCELRVTFYCTSYELLFVAQVTTYFLHTSYELLIIERITSFFQQMSSKVCSWSVNLPYNLTKAVYYRQILCRYDASSRIIFHQQEQKIVIDLEMISFKITLSKKNPNTQKSWLCFYRAETGDCFCDVVNDVWLCRNICQLSWHIPANCQDSLAT